MMRWILCVVSGLMASMVCFPAAQAQEPAVDPPSDSADSVVEGVPDPPPQPGPDLLKYTPDQIEAAYKGQRMPEAVSMYLVIARGGQLDGTSGWFHPAVSRYSWQWLADQATKLDQISEADEASETVEAHNTDEAHEADLDALTADMFPSRKSIAEQLDRNGDGMIMESDLDWSDGNPWVRQASAIHRFFRRMDAGGDGNLTAEEWAGFFQMMSRGSEGSTASIRPDQLRAALMPPAGPFNPGDAPEKETLIQGLMAGEIGSLQEGPELNQLAPDFELKPLGGGPAIRLSDRIGKRPVVLVFGNFTCGPFRSFYPLVEGVHLRQKENADFLMVYVREAHPTDGWAMKSNEKAGVVVAQPRTLEERQAVAEQCAAKLKPAMPLLIDDLDDTVGNAYSGMPARLYVIDTEGKVAYKSGRGPFGFKPEEMEQALLMMILDEAGRKQEAQ